MADLVMIKRRARAGEVGLFPAGEVFEEPFSFIKLDAEVDVSAKVRGTERYIKFSHVIAKMVADNSDIFADAEDARDALLIDCKHVRRKFDKLRQTAELVPKPTRDLDATAWLRLIKLMVYFATVNYGIPAEAFERETRAFMQQPEPPPHTEIPDGPMAVQADIASRPHDNGEDDAAHYAKQAREARNVELDQPAEPARRDMDDEEADTPAEPETAQPAAAANPPPPPADREPITWTVEMSGEPDWRVDLPGDAGTYSAYARAMLDRTTDQAGWITWWNSDEEFNRRVALKFGVMNKRAIEQLAAEKEWRT